MIEVPDRIASLPRDKRGYPIPFVSFIDTKGEPQFAVIDHNKADRAITFRLCGICGQTMVDTDHFFFVGGPICEVNGFFVDPAMHKECAEFSVKTCPHMAKRGTKYRIANKGGHHIMTAVSNVKAEKFGIFETHGYSRMTVNGQLLIRAELPWSSVRWFAEGKEQVNG